MFAKSRLDFGQRERGLSCKDAFRRVLSVDPPPGKIMGAVISDVLDNAGIDIGQIDESIRKPCLCMYGCGKPEA